MKVRPLHPTIGAEVTGVDLAGALDDSTVARIRAAWIEWGVLAFPDQPVSDAAQIAFSRRFGALEIFPQSDSRSAIAPEIFRVANTDEDGGLRSRGDPAARFLHATWMWHTDSSYRPIPSAGAVLHGIEVSHRGGETHFADLRAASTGAAISGCGGGETHFADLRAAWDAMPDALRDQVTGLNACHSYEFMRSRHDLPPMKPEEAATVPPVEHPLVRSHPESGRQSLYISPVYMRNVGRLDREATEELVRELVAWATQDRFVYRHVWRKDDVLMWDNRSTMHIVTPYDDTNVRRVMHRTTIQGTDPVALHG